MSPVSHIDLPVLRDLDEAARRRLLAAGEPRRFARREVVFHEGDPGDALHLILSTGGWRCA